MIAICMETISNTEACISIVCTAALDVRSVGRVCVPLGLMHLGNHDDNIACREETCAHGCNVDCRVKQFMSPMQGLKL